MRQIYSGIGTVGYDANYDPYGNVYASDGFGGTLGFTGEQTDVGGLQYLRNLISSLQSRYSRAIASKRNNVGNE